MYKFNRCNERPNMVNNDFQMNNMQYTYYNQTTMTNAGNLMCCEQPPIYECPQERVCHREFMHNVQHIVPINTRIINHHIYKHTYTPCYTSCEENEVSNVYDACNGQF